MCKAGNPISTFPCTASPFSRANYSAGVTKTNCTICDILNRVAPTSTRSKVNEYAKWQSRSRGSQRVQSCTAATHSCHLVVGTNYANRGRKHDFGHCLVKRNRVSIDFTTMNCLTCLLSSTEYVLLNPEGKKINFIQK
jgi:hypothetical protein